MIYYIAHRGNIEGKNSELENTPDYIYQALANDYHVEVDVWYHNCQLYLGHDKPLMPVPENLLSKFDIWWHAKDIETLFYLKQNRAGVRYFFHNKDACTLTSNNLIWTYPGKKLTPDSICVMPENARGFYTTNDLKGCAGICSDNIKHYKEKLNARTSIQVNAS